MCLSHIIFMLIFFILDGDFIFTPSTACSNNTSIKSYPTPTQAQHGCSNDSNCHLIVDYKCDGGPWMTCNGRIVTSTLGSCTWKKQGRQTNYLFTFQIKHNNCYTSKVYKNNIKIKSYRNI